MKRIYHILSASLILLSFQLAFGQNKTPKTIMLILGSADLPTLNSRVDVGFKLYKEGTLFDKIIVSGGCGAHGSTLCEASEMKRLLVEKGVPEGIIIKEERSKTTVQNYVYSRVLEDTEGHRVIQPGDTVYVVSNHWHAISVAARLNKYDHVTAYYHIEGNLQPRETDKVDYVSILYSYSDNNKFVRNALWPTANAVFRKSNTAYILIDSLVFFKTESDQEMVQPLKELFPALNNMRNLENIDAALSLDRENTLALIKEDSIFRFSLNNNHISEPVITPLSKLIKNLPANWHKIDALFVMKDSLYVFHDDELVVSVPKGKVYTALTPVKINQKIINFPFNWGGGYIDAVDYDPLTNTITLFKAKEQLVLDQNFRALTGKAIPFSLAWPITYYGEKD